MQSGDHAVCVAFLDHHHGEVVPAVQNSPRIGGSDPASFSQLMKASRVMFKSWRLNNVYDFQLRAIDAELLQQRGRDFLFHQENRVRQAFLDENLRRADDLFLIAFREDDALRIALRPVVHRMHHSSRPA